ncbi:MAG: peptidylprolyl isomerase [Roseinatronobacter sp.]
MSRFSPVAAVFSVALAFGLPLSAQDAPTRDTVLAEVGGTKITLGHLLAAHASLPDQFRMLPAETLFEPLIEQLIEQTVVADQARGALTAAERIALENEQRAFLANVGLTRAADAAVTDESITVAYQAFATEYAGREPTPEFNASHIIVETEEEALALRAQLDEGADFAELARAHSFDGAAANGGNLGWFGPGAMIPEFENAVKELEVGSYMGPLQTQFGWHLVLLNDTRMTTAPALEEVRDALVQGIQREAAQAELTRLKEAATITRNFEGLDPNLLTQTQLLDD